MTRVLLADDIVSAQSLMTALNESDPQIQVCGVARTPNGLFEEVRDLLPDIVVLREHFADVDVFALAEEVPTLSPGTRVVVIAPADTPEGRTRAMRAGIDQYVTGEVDGDTLASAIHAARRAEPDPATGDGRADEADATWGVVDRETRPDPVWVFAGPPGEGAAAVDADAGDTHPHMDGAPAALHGPGPDPAPARGPGPVPGTDGAGTTAGGPSAVGPVAELEPMQPVVRRKPQRRGGRKQAEIFVVFAGKGGVGKSTVATNLACSLAARGAKVAIIDLDLQFGDVGVMLGVEHPHSIEELAQVGEAVDMDYLEDILGTGPEDVRVLLAPSSPELAELVTTGTLRAIVRELARHFDNVIVDAAAHLEERTLEMLEMADHVVVVTAFNVTAVKDTKIMLKLLSSLGIPKEKIAVLLNQTRQKTNFTREEVEDSLRFRVVTHLPFEPRVVDESIDHGRPFVLHEPKAEITRQFQTLVDYISPPDDTPQGAEGEEDARGRTGKQKAGRRRFSIGRS